MLFHVLGVAVLDWKMYIELNARWSDTLPPDLVHEGTGALAQCPDLLMPLACCHPASVEGAGGGGGNSQGPPPLPAPAATSHIHPSFVRAASVSQQIPHVTKRLASFASGQCPLVVLLGQWLGPVLRHVTQDCFPSLQWSC